MLDLYVPAPSGKRLTYRTLKEHIKSLILSSQLPPGTRLPSVRTLAKRLEIASVTVQRAYAELAREGYTWAATKGGTWVSEAMDQSVLVEILARSADDANQTALELMAMQAGLRMMGLSKPDPALFDPSELLTELSELRGANANAWSYSAPEGAPELISQVIRIIGAEGIPVSSEQIVLTMGATHAISLIASCLPPGATVLLEDPHSGSIQRTLSQHGVRTVPFSHTTTGINLREIQLLLQTEAPSAIVVSPVFHNPTGCNLTDKDRGGLLELAREFSTKIVELDLYRPISFESAVPSPMAISGGSQVIYVGSLSHSLSPGLRLGYIRCTDRLRSQLVTTVRNTMVSLPSFTQLGMASYLARGGLTRHLARTVPKYKARRDALMTAVAQHMPFAKASYPKGGFTSWVGLPPGDYSNLEEAAIRRGVLIKSGSRFSSLGGAQEHIRLGFGCCSPDSIRESVRTLAELIEERSVTRHGKSA
jgi:DNA-binding transcriptional MocR family regulator